MGQYDKPSEDELRARLTAQEYEVTQMAGTEPPYSHKYNHEFSKGIYVDIVTGEPLFSSEDKYDAGCGWPSFSKPIDLDFVEERVDTSASRIRTEIVSQHGKTHLGHVFDDGPELYGGMRYCINGSALRFIPKEEMEAEGYGEYRYLFKDGEAD